MFLSSFPGNILYIRSPSIFTKVIRKGEKCPFSVYVKIVCVLKCHHHPYRGSKLIGKAFRFSLHAEPPSTVWGSHLNRQAFTFWPITRLARNLLNKFLNI